MADGERVVVHVKGGTIREGTVRERWHGPVMGACAVVDFDDGDWIIAPIASVRRLDESGA